MQRAGGGGGGASAADDAKGREGGSHGSSTGNSPREFAGRAPLDRALVEDAGARAARSIADVVRKVRRSEASSKTPTDPVTHRPNANPRRPPSRALVERERLRAVEARYAARQRHARESRAAVRENDPDRAERRRRAEEAAAARLGGAGRPARGVRGGGALWRRGVWFTRRLSRAAAVRGTDGDGDDKSAPGDGGGGGVFEGEDRGRRVRAEAAVGPDGSRGGGGRPRRDGGDSRRRRRARREAGDGDEEERASGSGGAVGGGDG